MSNLKCKKEILCLGAAISKLDGIKAQLGFLRTVSIKNYENGVNTPENEVDEGITKAEEIIKLGDMQANVLMK